MKVKIDINTVLFWTLLYPILLFVPSLFRINAFSVTAPYFFLVFLTLMCFLAFRKRLAIPRRGILALIALMLGVSIINFTTIRYSLPLFFTVYAFVLAVVMSSIDNRQINFKLFSRFLIVYIALSIPFIFLPQGYTSQQRFMGFVGSPTIYSGFITSIFVVISLRWKLTSIKFIGLYLLVFALVYLTKTRLLLIFLLIYPVLMLLLKTRFALNRKQIFVAFYAVTFLIYPLYNRVVEWFPSLLTLRYGRQEDASFRLRNYLFLESEKEYFSGSLLQMLFGRGNEYSRNFVMDLMDIDLMPHNDYMRILIDWGLIGFLVFSLLLFVLAIKNNYTLLLCLVYMILFYSNTVFNIYLFSLILIVYFIDDSQKNEYRISTSVSS